jgi:starch phosphorylase
LEQRTLNRPDWGLQNSVLDPRVLTIGFARRFATYKRGSLMLQDRDRLKQLLFHNERPIQIVIAGKAHPRDDAGKKIIQDLVNFIQNEGARSRMVFLEDYDMRVARMMVQGVDVWLNNPRRPYEASGTSGMKVVPNGALNCSVLDGWWDEGYDPTVGWAIGDRESYPDEGHQDWLDSVSLYDLLESEIAPLFYHRVDGGIPRGWIAMVKRSIQQLAPEFSTARMVRDYATKAYMPSALQYGKLVSDGLKGARAARDWREKIKQNWGQIQVMSVTDNAGTQTTVGKRIQVTAEIQIGVLSPDDIKVQAVVGRIVANRELANTEVFELKKVSVDVDKNVFQGEIDASIAGYQGYSVRVVPHHEDVAVPSELRMVTWES